MQDNGGITLIRVRWPKVQKRIAAQRLAPPLMESNASTPTEYKMIGYCGRQQRPPQQQSSSNDDASNDANCPICTLSMPMAYLNFTACCNQPICTSCFLKVRPPGFFHNQNYHQSLLDTSRTEYSSSLERENQRLLRARRLNGSSGSGSGSQRSKKYLPTKCPYCANGQGLAVRYAGNEERREARENEITTCHWCILQPLLECWRPRDDFSKQQRVVTLESLRKRIIQ